MKVDRAAVAAKIARWKLDCIQATQLTELRRHEQLDLSRAVIDSSSVCAVPGGKTRPNPTDRRKVGSKHHLITDANWMPLLTSINVRITRSLPTGIG